MKKIISEKNTREIFVEYPKSLNSESFIGIYDIGNEDVCKNLIKTIDEIFEDEDSIKEIPYIAFDDKNPNKNRQGLTTLERQDRAVFIDNPNHNEYTKNFSDWLSICVDLYVAQFSIDHQVMSPTNKFHQVEPFQNGYSVIHYEAASGESAARHLTWIFYLNDVSSGGETEFPQQGIRIKPKAGRLIIWPASYTHPHRGNPPYERKSYITGWFYGV